MDERFGRRAMLAGAIRLAAAVAVPGTLSGCAVSTSRASARSGSVPPAAVPPAPAPLTSARQAPLAEHLASALAQADRDAFASAFTSGARTLGLGWFDTWRAFATIRVEEGGPPSGRRSVLDLTWRVAGEDADSGCRLVLTLVGGLVDACDAAPSPVWLRRRGHVVAGGGAAVVCTTTAAEAEAWWVAARAAAAVVARSGAVAGPSGDLLVEVAADPLAFRRRDASGTVAGAVAYATAPAGRQACVVVDAPGTRSWPAPDRAGLLVHEAVHAAGRSAESAAPAWLVEGLADWVALPHWPAAARRSRLVTATLPPEVTVPAAEDFAHPVDAERAYVLAELAVAGLVREHGVEQVAGWLDTWPASAPPDAEVSAALMAELRRRR